MRGQSLIARKGYAAIGKTEEPIVGEMSVALHEVDREKHLDDMLAGREEIIGLIKEAMASIEPCSRKLASLFFDLPNLFPLKVTTQLWPQRYSFQRADSQ